MRALIAVAAAALLTAGPAGAVSIPTTFPFSVSLKGEAKQERTRSCQAGSHDKIVLHQRHPQILACEQPPKPNLATPGALAKAAAALNFAG